MKYLLILPLLGIGFTLALGSIYQYLKSKNEQLDTPCPGKLVQVNGRLMHVNYIGNGAGPTVVLDAGMGGTSLGWVLVQNKLTNFSNVCSFDRAGYGWSEESEKERTSANVVDEIHTLLHQANIPGPYIMVGHSFGGANVLFYAHTYPEEVVGVVLVDSVHEDYFKKLPPEKSQGLIQGFLKNYYVKIFAITTGIRRFFWQPAYIEEMFRPLPENIRELYVAHMNRVSYVKTVARELSLLPKSLRQLDDAKINLGSKPLAVIVAGTALQNSDTDEFTNTFNTAWLDMQRDHLSKSSNSELIFAMNSDHMINHHEPEVIVEAVNEMLGAFKEGRLSPTTP